MLLDERPFLRDMIDSQTVKCYCQMLLSKLLLLEPLSQYTHELLCKHVILTDISYLANICSSTVWLYTTEMLASLSISTHEKDERTSSVRPEVDNCGVIGFDRMNRRMFVDDAADGSQYDTVHNDSVMQ